MGDHMSNNKAMNLLGDSVEYDGEYSDLKVGASITLKSILQALNRPMWINPVTGGIRVVDTVTTVTTVTAVTTASAFGVSTTGPMKAEDVAAATGDMGFSILAVRRDVDASNQSANNDYAPPSVDSAGNLKVTPLCSKEAILKEAVSNTDGASTALTVFGATASNYNYITTIAIYNTSVAGVMVDIRDGTGGAVIFSMYVPATGGNFVNFTVPLRQPTVNTALAFDAAGATTTLWLNFIGFKSVV